MTISKTLRAGTVSGLALGFVALGSGGAAAQIIVLQSNIPQLKTGAVLSGSSKVSIPGGKRVVFMLPSGTTRTVAGPFDGPASKLDTGNSGASNGGLLDAVKRYVETGGATSSTVGAMRSAAPSGAFGKTPPFTWQSIPVTSRDNVCLARGKAWKFVRSRFGRDEAFTLVRGSDDARAQVYFARGDAEAAWPTAFKPAAGKYTLLSASGALRELQIKVMAEPPKNETLRALHQAGCTAQFRTALKDLQKEAN